MAAYPYLVQIAWDAVENFVKDWQQEPYKWYTETDIQTEIASRIRFSYQVIGKGTVLGNYTEAVAGFERNQTWSRVSCQPTVTYTHSDRRKYYCYPDIVIWEDLEDPNSPPDQTEGANWPMLWVCEIKFNGQPEEDWDLAKMRYLVAQNEVKYGCWLNMFRRRAETGSGISWERSLENQRLWVCTAMLPALL